MDENTRERLTHLLMALKSLSRSVEKSYFHGAVQGVGDMVAKSYRILHAHVLELTPDDFYIRDALALDGESDVTDKQRVMQVKLLANQLTDYLENLLQIENRLSLSAEVNEIRGLARDLSDQISSYTRETLKRVLSTVGAGMLPELQRQTLILYAEEEMSYGEIAQAMNCSMGTVKSRLFYARKTLRHFMRPDTLKVLDADAPRNGNGYNGEDAEGEPTWTKTQARA